MTENETLQLSICIPCFKRVEELRNTLRSIYEVNNDVELSLFEVVISDNDKDKEVEEVFKEFAHYGNISYHYSECEGFKNSYYALSYGRGKLLKLNNSQFCFKKGAIRQIIDDSLSVKQEASVIFYSGGFLSTGDIKVYNSFDSFIRATSYWTSWSNGVCIWKSEFDKVKDLPYNALFPHTSLLYTQTDFDTYLVNDMCLFEGQRIKKRGGHNKFEAFTIEYPSLVAECYEKGAITKSTHLYVTKELMCDFLPTLTFNKYFSRIETFDATGFKENIKRYFPKYAYTLIWLLAPFTPFRIGRRRLKMYLNSRQK